MKRYNPTETTGIIPKNSGVLCFADEAQAEIDDLARQRDKALARAEKAEGSVKEVYEVVLGWNNDETVPHDEPMHEICAILEDGGFDLGQDSYERLKKANQ